MPEHERTLVYKRTNCRLCGYLCGLIALVEEGKVISVEPDPSRYPYDASIVRGCHRYRVNPEILDHPQRINYPLKRSGDRGSGRWERVPWDQALNEIAGRLDVLKDRYGPETLATAIGGARAAYWPLHRFLNLFGSPNNIGIGQICWNPAIWINSITYGWPIENELVPGLTTCAILWGTNPAASDGSLLWRTVLQFVRGGGRLIVVDPRRTRTAEKNAFWLPLQPGTDCALAMGLLNVVVGEELYDKTFIERWCSGFDRLRYRLAEYPLSRVEQITGVPAADIQFAARAYAAQKPAAILSGRGLDQIGPGSAQALRALAILRAITGNLDAPGASHISSMPDFIPEVDLELDEALTPAQRQKQLGADRILLQTYRGYDLVTAQTMKAGKRLPMRYLTSAHPNLVWKAMLEGKPYPIRAMITMASNPLLDQGDSRRVYAALKSLDLLVSLEYFLTPSAMLADYVLPIAGTLERPVLQTDAGVSNFAYGGEAAQPPLYERRTDFDFWRALGCRLGQEQYWPWQDLRQAFQDVLAPTGYSWEAFCQTGLYSTENRYRQYEEPDNTGGAPTMNSKRPLTSQRPLPPGVRGFATPSGKVEIYSELLEQLGYDPLPGMVSRKSGGKPADLQASADKTATEPPSGDYPLTLITGARRQPYYASEFRQVETLRLLHPKPWAEVSPETASQLNLHEGDPVWVETHQGRACFEVKVSPMRAGLVSVEYGWWYPEKAPDIPVLRGVWISNANTLTSAEFENCDPLIGQWAYNGLPCRISPNPAPSTANPNEPECL
jgi:anaerobic selenocysteine-containing dehydrogenase